MDCRVSSGMVSSRIGDESKLSQVDLWLGSSVVRVLAWYARGPGFESRSGHVLFPPLFRARAASSKETLFALYRLQVS